MFLKRSFSVIGGVVLAALGVSYLANKGPLGAADTALLTDRLFEFGAVDFVHGFYDGPQSALFDCVAKGQSLSPSQSAMYRQIYQGLLVDKQALFRRLDANLVLQTDVGTEQKNNVGSLGITGLHDHHDASAASNISNIAEALDNLETANAIARALLANDIYKDLTDLMVHMAPAVHSIGLLKPDDSPDALPDDLRQAYAAFYEAMKLAQSVAINSAAYWEAIDRAKTAYAALVILVQGRVRERNGPALHSLSGSWLSLQTVAPRLNVDSPSAADRQAGKETQSPCPA